MSRTIEIHILPVARPYSTLSKKSSRTRIQRGISIEWHCTVSVVLEKPKRPSNTVTIIDEITGMYFGLVQLTRSVYSQDFVRSQRLPDVWNNIKIKTSKK